MIPAAQARVEFSQETHTYRVNGVVIPSHTSCLHLGGLVPYAAVEPDVLERKAELGRETHKACLLYDGCKKFTCDKLVEPRLQAWIDFRTITKFKPRLMEHRGLCEVQGMLYGMTIDREGDFGGEEALIEIKCTAQILPHHGIQLAGQTGGLYHPELKTALARFRRRTRYVVRLDEKGKFKVKKFEDPEDIETFIACLRLAHWKLRHGQIYKGAENGPS